MIKNLVAHILVPKGLKLLDGSVLAQDTTFDVVSQLDPFYASIDQVRLDGGMYISKLSDITIAATIYKESGNADMFCFNRPTDATTRQYQQFVHARNMYVSATVAKQLILNVKGFLGASGAHVLGNFSVQRKNDDLEGKLAELNKTIQDMLVVVKTGGTAIPGGKPKPNMAAKGVNDWGERTPSRTWINTGLGANSSSLPFSSTTGRGKSVKLFVSPPLISFRTGVYATGALVPIAPYGPVIPYGP